MSNNLDTYFDVRKTLESFLAEDLGRGDVTSESVIPPSLNARAEIVCKAGGSVVCGLEEAQLIFEICHCQSKALIADGTVVKKKQTRVMEISGNARSILKAERTALNLIMRMSGIATETRKFVDKAGDRPIKIASTRKTAPGLRYFDKKAVVLGGGYPHRMRLDDMVLIKDNHLVLTKSIEKSIELAKKNAGSAIRVECEARNPKEAITAAKAGADIVMLDNFSVSDAVSTIKKIRKANKKTLIEISGGINIDNVRNYARARPDIMSIGYITHSPKAIDFSLEII